MAPIINSDTVPPAYPEMLVTRIAAYLNLDSTTQQELNSLFTQIPPTISNSEYIMTLGDISIVCQFPKYIFNRNIPYQFRIFALNLIEHCLVSDVYIHVIHAETQKYLCTGRTGEQGDWCASCLIPDTESTTLEIKVMNGKNTKDNSSSSMNQIRCKITPYLISTATISCDKAHFHIYTDKKIYRPTEVVRLVGICWHEVAENFFPLPSSVLMEYCLISPANRVLFRQKLTLSPEGVVWGDFPIVASLPEGIYTIELKSPEIQCFVRTSIEVKHYQRPEIEYQIALDSDWILTSSSDSAASENLLRYPIRVQYYYGDPVVDANIELSIDQITIKEYDSWETFAITPTLIITSAQTDSDGVAQLTISHILEVWNKWFTLSPSNSIELKSTHDGHILHSTGFLKQEWQCLVVLKVTDRQNHMISASHDIRCQVNRFELNLSLINLNIPQNLVEVTINLHDLHDRGYFGQVNVSIEDNCNICQTYTGQHQLDSGKITIPLIPFVTLPSHPQIQLRGIITFIEQQQSRSISFTTQFPVDTPEKNRPFELRFPQGISIGKEFLVECWSHHYVGSISLTYGKYQTTIFKQGIITSKTVPFQHTLFLSQPFVGDLFCAVTYIDFSQENPIQTEIIKIPLPITPHLLSYVVDHQKEALPGDQIPVQIKKTDRSADFALQGRSSSPNDIASNTPSEFPNNVSGVYSPPSSNTPVLDAEPWLMVVKLADKSLRGLQGMTSIDPFAIYRLHSKFDLQIEYEWLTKREFVLSDIEKYLTQTLELKFELNNLIHILKIHFYLKTHYPKTWSDNIISFFNRRWIALQGDPTRLCDFFAELDPLNLNFIVSYLGIVFFPEDMVTISHLIPIIKIFLQHLISYPDHRIFVEILSYFARITLKHFHHFLNTDSHQFGGFFRPKSGDHLILETYSQIQTYIDDMLQFLKKHSQDQEIYDEFRRIQPEINGSEIPRRMVFQHYRQETALIECLKHLQREKTTLESRGYADDPQLLEIFLERLIQIKDYPQGFFPDLINFEADSIIWNLFLDLRSFLSNHLSRHSKLFVKFQETIDQLFSINFYEKCYDNDSYRLLYQDPCQKFLNLLHQLQNLRNRSDLLQKVVFYGIILKDLDKYFYTPFKLLRMPDLFPCMMYYFAWYHRLIGVMDTAIFQHESIIKLESTHKCITYLQTIQNNLSHQNFIQSVFSTYFKDRNLEFILSSTLDTFIDQISIWKSTLIPVTYTYPLRYHEKQSITLDLPAMWTDLFSKTELTIQNTFFGSLIEFFSFYLRQGIDFENVTPFTRMFELVKHTEKYFRELYCYKDKLANTPPSAQPMNFQEQLDLIEKEKLFNTIYFQLLQLFKTREIILANLFQFSSFIHFNHNYGMNYYSHAPLEYKNDFEFYSFANFVSQMPSHKIPMQKDHTLLQDYIQYRQILTFCAQFFTSVIDNQISRNDDEKALNFLTNLPQHRSFNNFWTHYYISNLNDYLEFSTASLNQASSDLVALIAKEGSIFPDLDLQMVEKFWILWMHWIEEISQEFLIFWRTNLPSDFIATFSPLLAAFRSTRFGQQHPQKIHFLEWSLLQLTDKMKEYFLQIETQWSQRELPIFGLWDDLAGCYKQQTCNVPIIVGYRNYISIMTDVSDSDTPSPTPENSPAKVIPLKKKTTIRSNFADIGHYQVIPIMQSPELTVPIRLPDSITTQELHVAAFDGHTRMNYQISEIAVKQELFIKDDLPDELRLKDEIECTITLTNTTSHLLVVNFNVVYDIIRQISCSPFTLTDEPSNSFSNKAFHISTALPQSIQIPPKNIVAIPLHIRALRCGDYLFHLIADCPGFHDEIKKQLIVKAPGLKRVQNFLQFLPVPLSTQNSAIPLKYTIPLVLPQINSSQLYDYNAHISIYPDILGHIIDGIEANLRYPYGCLEQTVSALMPNLAFYGYLKESNQNVSPIFAPLCEKLTHNIIQGYLQLQGMQNSDGGFGWWSSEPSNIFTTSLAIGAYTLLYRHGFLVETVSLHHMIQYLMQTSFDSEVFHWKIPKNPQWYLKMYTDTSLSAYIIANLVPLKSSGVLSQHELFIIQKIAQQITPSIWQQITDCNALYSIFQILASIKSPDLPVLAEYIKNLRIGSFWMKTSGLGSHVEITAQLLQVLGIHGFLTELEQNIGIEWIFQQKNPSGGWNSTADTRAVVEMLSSLYHPSPTELTLSIECNKQNVINSYQISPQTLVTSNYYLQSLSITSMCHIYSQTESTLDDQITVILQGQGNPMIKITQEFWIDDANIPKYPLSIMRIVSTESKARFSKISIQLKYEISAELNEMIVIEEPIIPAGSIEVASLEDLVKAGQLVGFQIRSNQIAMFVPSGTPLGSISYNLYCSKRFEGTQSPPCIYPMYTPQSKQYGNVSKYLII